MSNRIRALQEYLNANGFSCPVDGSDGPKTTAALVACQKARGGALRRVNRIVVHCTATPAGRDVSVATITQMHKDKGWATIGYHRVVLLDGTRAAGRPEAQVGSHVAGHNSDSIGVVYVGGLVSTGKTLVGEDTRTDAQKTSLEAELKELAYRYPGAVIVGHRDLSPDKNNDGVISKWEWMKECPCFDAPAEYRRLQIVQTA